MSAEIDVEDFSKKTAFHDIGLAVEDEIFWVSKGALAYLSPVFRAMFYGQFEESKKDIIPLPDKKADEISVLLQFLFCSNPKSKKIDDENVKIILKFVDEYELYYLKKKCKKFLVDKMKSVEKDEDILDLFVIGVQYKIKALIRGTFAEVQRLSKEKLQSAVKGFPAKVRSALAKPIPEPTWNHEMKQAHHDMESMCEGCCDDSDIEEEPGYGDRCVNCDYFACEDHVDPAVECVICGQCSSKNPRTGVVAKKACYCISKDAISDLTKADLW